MNYNSTPINVTAGSTLTLYSKSYNFLINQCDMIDINNITCYDETNNSYVYSNINNVITSMCNEGIITLGIAIIKNHIYTLTFRNKDKYSENKIFKLKIKGV